MEPSNVTVHSLLLPMQGTNLLLPNASVAEIIEYSEPEPAEDSPDWYKGMLEWRGLKVPLVAFEVISGKACPAMAGNERISILNALGGKPDMPYFAIITQGIPRLSLVNQEMITLAGEEHEAQACVLSNVLVRGEWAQIPDLAAIECLIRESSCFQDASKKKRKKVSKKNTSADKRTNNKSVASAKKMPVSKKVASIKKAAPVKKTPISKKAAPKKKAAPVKKTPVKKKAVSKKKTIGLKKSGIAAKKKTSAGTKKPVTGTKKKTTTKKTPTKKKKAPVKKKSKNQ